ncbi:uncharacterized protein LOC115970384 [Quercus lobata]|uniref:uncharacterized protein LOC115970384 n=1 Tax=Quercus lobata TaxID=97700 RepID=UPI0012454656|nr:uncharacterized protein LOC115970384 [Quercus lobata]
MWNTEKVNVTQLAKSEQETHVSVKVISSNLDYILTTIYASPRFREICILWNNLKNVANLCDKRWIIAGDFNEMLVDGDKFGGRTVSANWSLIFKECLDSCNMIDLGFTGPRFTLSNRRDILDLIQERIDRFFANPSWCALHPNARVSHLVRCHSNHCPILLESDPGSDVYLPQPFRFQSFWLEDPTFPRVVSDTWDQSSSLQEVSENFATKAVDWNKNHFGNIFIKKKLVMAKLGRVQKVLTSHPSSSLLALENNLHSELNDILSQEEELWVQKSRINRLVHGDRNTSFYHVSTIVRRRRNCISCIKNDAGGGFIMKRRLWSSLGGGLIGFSLQVWLVLPSLLLNPLGGILPSLRRRRIPFACLFLMEISGS